jgi:hypothetical protein
MAKELFVILVVIAVSTIVVTLALCKAAKRY